MRTVDCGLPLPLYRALMSTPSQPTKSRRDFSVAERRIIAVQFVVAVGFGAVALFQVNDPDWGDLQRFLIIVLLCIWLVGIAVSVVVARLVDSSLGRIAILVVGPFAGFLLMFGWSMFG